MKRTSALPELLAPAGDFQSLIAAVSAGADAVYLGGKAFGARAYAKNFDTDELREAVKYCHLHGVRLYVTVNTLIYDKELREISDYAASLYEMGVDALIISDLGAIREIRRRLPDFELHASTQMSVHSADGAKVAAKLGCSRVVLARELSYENIKLATEGSPIETEVFLHGALCVCHSGQCLFSSLVGGRSGNRGECAQPCRLPFGGGYPLSLSDLSLANHIEELIATGTASLKIEGRMKSPEYVYTVTSIYRRLLDEHRSANGSELATLKAAFSRGGFTDGYFTSRVFSKMTGIRSESDKNDTRSLGERKFEPETRRISAIAKILRARPAELSFSLDGRTVSVLGDVPSEAISAPLTEEGVRERLAKLGGTYLTLDPGDIEVTLDAGLNLSPSSLNALRRAAADALTMARRAVPTAEYTPELTKRRTKKLSTALFLHPDLLTKVYTQARKCFDLIFVPLFDFTDESVADGVYIPPVVTDSERDTVRTRLEAAVRDGAKYALVGNVGHLELIRDLPITPVGDFRLNVTNAQARAAYADLGIEDTLLSAELTLPMARDIGGGTIVYGRIPLMLTERCFMKENFGCENCSECSLTDRRGVEFPMLREHEHRNLILNSAVTYMGDRAGELSSAGLLHRHSIFSVESEGEASAALAALQSGTPLPAHVTARRMGRRDVQKPDATAKKPDKKPVRTPKNAKNVNKHLQSGGKNVKTGTFSKRKGR